MTPEQVVEKINNSITEKTQGFAKADDLAQIKTDIATVKEMSEKITDFDDSELKTAITDLEAKFSALKEEPKKENAFKSLGNAIFDAFKNATEQIKEVAAKGGLMSLISV